MAEKPVSGQLIEFDFVGEILGNMEPLPRPKSKDKSKSPNRVNTQSGGHDGKSLEGSTKAHDKTKMATTLPVPHAQSHAQPKPGNSNPSKRPESIGHDAPQASVSKESSEINAMSAMMTNFQAIMASQLQMMKDMRADMHQYRADDPQYMEVDIDDCDDAESLDVCDQIDQFLNNSADDVSSKDPAPVQSSNDDIPDFLRELANDFSTDDSTGPDIENATLAKLLTDMLTKRMSDDKLKMKLEMYPRPMNMEHLQAPKVNPEIWRKLSTENKSRDVRVQKAQTRIAKGLTPLARMIALLMEVKKNTNMDVRASVDELLKLALDSFTLTASATQEISQRRRELIKPDLNNQYASLCSTHNPVTTMLFGDDLPKAMKDIHDTNRVASNIGGSYGSYRGKGQSRYMNKGKQALRFNPYYHGQRGAYNGNRGGYNPRGGYQDKKHWGSKNGKKGPDRK
ncbi:uncharacterized protein [Argopecten irradians]|uniref:uncharacterized protein n=1 Tax=Argopecten irradians TaxID=31199 RepID=UPI00371B96A0